jgi:hypothetical protein
MRRRTASRDTRENAALIVAWIEKILAEAKDEGPVRQVELIYGILTSPAAAWLVGKTESEVLAEAEQRGWGSTPPVNVREKRED